VTEAGQIVHWNIVAAGACPCDLSGLRECFALSLADSSACRRVRWIAARCIAQV